MESDDDTCSRVLNLPNNHLHDLNELHIPETLTDIDLTCNRLKSIDIRILSLRDLRSLSFRQNLLSDEAEVSKLISKTCLEYLELRDNNLHTVPELTGFEKLQGLELSYNHIRSLKPLTSLNATCLESFFVASNKVTAIESLEAFPSLKLLELGFNRIRTIENISHLHILEELWIGRNRITSIDNLSSLTRLKKISVQSNRLSSMKGIRYALVDLFTSMNEPPGLEECIALEEIYLSHNGIMRLEVNRHRSQVERSCGEDVSNNRISKMEGLQSLARLEDLWLNDNQLSSWVEVETALEVPRASLTTIYLENNPIASDEEYKTRIRAILPNLRQLDADDLSDSGQMCGSPENNI